EGQPGHPAGAGGRGGVAHRLCVDRFGQYCRGRGELGFAGQHLGGPDLNAYRVGGALAAIIILTVLNLRGVRESATIFSAPTYIFLLLMYGMLGLGLFQFFTGTLGEVTGVPAPVPPGVQAVTIFVLLRAFASGCAALTGIEAISDGVPAFKKPEARNAAT